MYIYTKFYNTPKFFQQPIQLDWKTSKVENHENSYKKSMVPIFKKLTCYNSVMPKIVN